jgi:hypothetical protein
LIFFKKKTRKLCKTHEKSYLKQTKKLKITSFRFFDLDLSLSGSVRIGQNLGKVQARKLEQVSFFGAFWDSSRNFILKILKFKYNLTQSFLSKYKLPKLYWFLKRYKESVLALPRCVRFFLFFVLQNQNRVWKILYYQGFFQNCQKKFI